MHKSWLEFVDNIESFAYQFVIPISNIDFKERILEFDNSFLSAADRMGFFKYPDREVVSACIRSRKANFLSETRQWVELLDLEQIPESSILNMSFLVPDESGDLETVPFHRPFVNFRLLELTRGNIYHMSELEVLESWKREVSVSISSHSTICWDVVDVKLDDGGYPILPPRASA